MITRNKKELTLRYWGALPIKYIYIGLKLVWSSVSSSFGGGGWANNEPWSNYDSWSNN